MQRKPSKAARPSSCRSSMTFPSLTSSAAGRRRSSQKEKDKTKKPAPDELPRHCRRYRETPARKGGKF